MYCKWTGQWTRTYVRHVRIMESGFTHAALSTVGCTRIKIFLFVIRLLPPSRYSYSTGEAGGLIRYPCAPLEHCIMSVVPSLKEDVSKCEVENGT